MTLDNKQFSRILFKLVTTLVTWKLFTRACILFEPPFAVRPRITSPFQKYATP